MLIFAIHLKLSEFFSNYEGNKIINLLGYLSYLIYACTLLYFFFYAIRDFIRYVRKNKTIEVQDILIKEYDEKKRIRDYKHAIRKRRR